MKESFFSGATIDTHRPLFDDETPKPKKTSSKKGRKGKGKKGKRTGLEEEGEGEEEEEYDSDHMREVGTLTMFSPHIIIFRHNAKQIMCLVQL